VNILPNKLLGIIGEHEDFPVERLAMSRDRKYMASCSHDNSIKFWNVSYLWNEDEDDEEESPNKDVEMKDSKEEDMDEIDSDEETSKNNGKQESSLNVKKKKNFFSGML
jgi:WD40 repeat protein